MTATPRHLKWLDEQADTMRQLVEHWASINTHAMNLDGLSRMAVELEEAFTPLGGELKHVNLPPRRIVNAGGQLVDEPCGKALHIVKRPLAARRILLCIHMDTIYSSDHPFQQVRTIDANKLRGPGVADAKGGIVVMLKALEAFERSPLAKKLGWEVLLTPDEEVGAPCSTGLLREIAERCDAGFVYEPAMPDGSLAGARGGSGNFSVVVHGRMAHAGRDFSAGRNAITAVSRLMLQMDQMTDDDAGLTINVGQIEGGGALNMVPDLAVARFNVRYDKPEQEPIIRHRIETLVQAINRQEGYSALLHGDFNAPPKPVDPQTRALQQVVEHAGRATEVPIFWRSTRGVCDGNRLAAAGLPTIDTMGPVGGYLHSDQEFVDVDSLLRRAHLSAAVFAHLAQNDDAWPQRLDAAR